MAFHSLPIVTASIDLSKPCSEEELGTTIEEDGFAKTHVSGEKLTPVQRVLEWRPPTHDDERLNVLGELGRGGMSTVLLVEQPALNREVAVKVARTEQAAKALLGEAKLNGTVEHPGVIPVYALISDEQGQPAIVMRKVDAVSWRVLLKDPNHPLWSQRAVHGDRLESNVRILLSVCDTLASAHSRGVIHRDVKPDNVLVGRFGEVFLADWGIATRLNEQKVGHLVGTAAYIAPEMARTQRVDERTDVFLIGATLYELINHRTPFTGKTLADALIMAASGSVRPVTSTAPRELAAICARAMAVDPAHRFQSVVELKAALSEWLSRRASMAIGDQTWERVQELERATQGPSRKEVYRLLAQCRFGFALALQEWKDNVFAERGLERAVLLAAEYELKNRRPDAARALLAEVKQAPARLSGAVDEMELSSRKALERLHALLASADPRTEQRRRTIFVLVLCLELAGFIAASLHFPDWFSGRWSLVKANLLFDGLFVATVLLTGWNERRRLTWMNRSTIGSLAVMALGALGLRTLGAVLELPHLAVLSFELLSIATACTALGLVLHRGFLVSPPFLLATAAVMVTVGRWPLELYTAGLAVGMLAAALAVRFGRAVIVAITDEPER